VTDSHLLGSVPDATVIKVSDGPENSPSGSGDEGLRTWVFDANVTDRMLNSASKKLSSVKKIQTNATGNDKLYCSLHQAFDGLQSVSPIAQAR